MTTLDADAARSVADARRRNRLTAVTVITIGTIYLAYGLMTSQSTFGCDFLAYFNAANRWLAGTPIYDFSVTSTGTCGTYQYPPPFVLVALPFSLGGFTLGAWLWVAFLLACWIGGTALLPVGLMTRWTILLFGAIGWPLIFGVRIGQVAPILYLVFAVGWRSLSRPIWLGASIAAGTIVKLQPALLALWLLVRRDWRAMATAAVAGAAVVAIAAVLGLRDWIGMATLLRSITDAVTSDANVAIGATLHRGGMDAGLAGSIQTLNAVAVVVIVAVGGWRLPPVPGFLLAVVGSQLVSPIVWTHYALVLLLPVAWLLDRRQWWALAIPIAQLWILVPFLPLWSYTVQFYAAFLAVLVVGLRSRVEDTVAVAAGAALEQAGATPNQAPI